MKKSILLGSLVLSMSLSAFAGGSDVGSSNRPEVLTDCMGFLADFSREEVGTELAIYKAIALNNNNLIWKSSTNGRTSALVTLGTGNDYQDLYLITIDDTDKEIFQMHKFNYLFSKIKLNQQTLSDGIFEELNLQIVNPKSVEDKETTSYALTLFLKGSNLDAEKCLRRVR